jgi:hypothetical protein
MLNSKKLMITLIKFRPASALLIFSLFAFSGLSGQESSRPGLLFGVEFQAYPTGILPGVRVELPVSNQDGIHLRLGYNAFDHRDLGVQDKEVGGGFGGTIGYRHYFGSYEKFFLGARNDLWFNTVNWTKDPGGTNEMSGTTEIVVVQPTAEAGYMFTFSDKWSLAPSIGFGFEINAVSNGADVGQGAILLLGVSAMVHK